MTPSRWSTPSPATRLASTRCPSTSPHSTVEPRRQARLRGPGRRRRRRRRRHRRHRRAGGHHLRRQGRRSHHRRAAPRRLRQPPLRRRLSDARSSRLVIVDVESAQRATHLGDRRAHPWPGARHRRHRLRPDLRHRRRRRPALRRPRRQPASSAPSTIARHPTQLALSADGTRAYVVDYDHVAVLWTPTNDGRRHARRWAHVRRRRRQRRRRPLYVADYSGDVDRVRRRVAARRCCTRSSWPPTRSVAPQVRELARAGA